ncbi:MAG: hypothetical protein Q7R66_09275 [Undibacterium sp.]|uniref:hypothetical protein n=1 Tax=Undibacterium sp. TaxID=1914977 RepID=UPI00272139B6|nr:hypothetical protein [Undibacterium sp.]MDO8652367.1 hypothetical protein [Undibacterium sp.]
MSKLLDYLNALDKDAAAREAHAKDPTAAMTAFGLTADEQAALMSGDKKKVAALVGINEDALPSILVNIATF